MATETLRAETDTILISRIHSGDSKCFEQIIRRYNPYLYRIGRTYGYNHQDTEDLMQDTFINAYCNLSKFEERASFRTWLTRIMINNCYHKKRKAGHQFEELPKDTLQVNPLYQKSMTSENYVMNKELGQIIEDALNQIPEDYRIVFTLRELNGNSVLETSQALDISESNVKIRLSRAKVMLRKNIELSYSPEDIYEFNLVHCTGIVDSVFSQLSLVR